VVGLFARWDPHKDHAGFVAAAARLRRLLPDVRYVLAGAGIGPENRSLVELLDAQGLGFAVPGASGRGGVDAEVLLPGELVDMPAALSALDVLASSSRGEAFPNILAEAMSCERTCVVTDVGESAYIVAGFGRVVPAGDPDALAAALATQLALAPLARAALGARARESIRERFSIDQVRERHATLYRRLLAAQRG